MLVEKEKRNYFDTGFHISGHRLLRRTLVHFTLVQQITLKPYIYDNDIQQCMKEQYISDTTAMLQDDHDELSILTYLRQQGIEPEESKEIIEAARMELMKSRLQYAPKKNKRTFYIWLSITAIILIADLIILPRPSLVQYTVILSMLGAAAFVFSGYMCILYYNSWTPEFLKYRESPKLNFSFLPIFLIPAVIVYFIISAVFSSVEKRSLSQNKIKATGTIIDGHSYASRRLDFSEVTVEFTTKEGEIIVATEDISKYSFKKFYKGQKVDLIYSAIDPQNIDLLTEESDVKGLTDSEERDITASDLVDLMRADPLKAGDQLDKITFGWNYDTPKGLWSNSRKDLAMRIGPNEVIFFTRALATHIYPKQFIALGFKQTSESSNIPFSRKPQVFENAVNKATISVTGDGTRDIYMITIIKK